MNKKIVNAKVIAINKTHLEVKCKTGQIGIVHISQISDYYVANLTTMFKKGNNYWFLIIDNKNHDKLELSWKQIHPRFLKSPFEFAMVATKQGFKNLKKAALKEVEDD